ncbi:MAG: hypothetical protein Q9184_006348 [Pyrenodesmia sp. 2 TL-2023]
MRTILGLMMLISLLRCVIGKPLCFSQPARPRPQLLRAVLQDCLDIAELIIQGDKAYAPMHWSRHKDVGWTLPVMWDIWGKSCFVTVDMLPGYYDDVVVFPPEAIARTAVNIINWCQTSPKMPNLGGRDVVGPEEKTIVILAGKIPEKGPKPPGFWELKTLARQSNASHDTS